MLKWMKTPEAQRIATAAQEKAWKDLQQQFPRADRSKFVIQADFIKKPQGNRTSIFKNQRRPDECFRLR